MLLVMLLLFFQGRTKRWQRLMPRYVGHSEKTHTVPEFTGFTIVMEYNSSDRKKAESTYKNMTHKGLTSSYFASDNDQKWRSRKSRRKYTQYFP